MFFKTVICIILLCQFNYLFGQDIDLSNHPFRHGETDHYEVFLLFNRVDTINICEYKEWSYNLSVKHIDVQGSNYIYGVKMAVNGRIPNYLINIGTFEFEFKVSTYGEILGIENWSYIKNSIQNRMGLTKEFDVIILFEDLLMHIYGIYGNKYIRGKELVKASQKLVGENNYIDTDVYINFQRKDNEFAYLTLTEKVIEREKSSELFNQR